MPEPTAFLVLAHHQPDMLQRLLNRLRADWAHAFIHLDAKAPMSEFTRVVGNDPCWTFAPAEARVAIHWCGFSMVTATLNLLKQAAKDPRCFRRFFLLSGADYPIKSIEDIATRINGVEENIRVDRQLDANGQGWFDLCANRFFFGDDRLLNPRSGYPAIGRIAREVGSKMKRRWPEGVSIYYGPSWWCLSREAVEEILRVADRNDTFLPWFRYSRSPDEMVFQTILKRSPLSERLAWDATRSDASGDSRVFEGTHYVDWDNPNPNAPRTLDISDLSALRRSDALFARKFTAQRSRELMDALDALHTQPHDSRTRASTVTPAHG